MKPHPLTLEHLRTLSRRPGMFMHDFDLRDLELQLYGFEAGLDAAGVLDDSDRFNRAFSDFLTSTIGLSCSLGWAEALLREYGQSEATFNKFLIFVKEATFERSPSWQRDSGDT